MQYTEVHQRSVSPHLDGDHGLGPFPGVPDPDGLVRAARGEDCLLRGAPLEVLDAALVAVERPTYLPSTALLDHVCERFIQEGACRLPQAAAEGLGAAHHPH